MGSFSLAVLAGASTWMVITRCQAECRPFVMAGRGGWTGPLPFNSNSWPPASQASSMSSGHSWERWRRRVVS